MDVNVCECEEPSPFWVNASGRTVCVECLNLVKDQPLTDVEKEILLNVFLRILKNEHDGYICVGDRPNVKRIVLDSEWPILEEEIPLLNRMIKSWAN